MYTIKTRFAALGTAALLALSLTACGAKDTAGVAADEQTMQQVDLNELVDLPDEGAPLAATNPVLNGVLTPEASGAVTYGNDKVTIDASHTDQGYVMVQYATGESARIKVQITRSGGTTYTYNLDANGQYDVFPLSQGSGAYQVNVFRNVEGTRYAQEFGQSISVSLSDDLLPFLYPNQYVDFNDSSNVVSVAEQLSASAGNELDKVTAIYNYTVQNISYDYDLAKNAPSTYLPDVDAVLASKKGICFDYAAVMTSMLRSQGIPTKLIVGYTSRGEYHAWISTHISEVGWINNVISFDGTNWKLMDPTFASTGKSSQQIMEYINNPANYTEKYCY
ncbi:transglutaminase-like domain-containing protein [Butyricicoccus faecihominis]|uniref:transglutaminase-like domain-containing protein n=1 Tax=Butyricicoccaceae TaxID=3085642 RepID=UPI00247A5D4C|nr:MULTISPECIES: transglutaminase-like domain-containing protein [Butyricicoccaceae]MCQ5131061.1 transglutaminase-like domain-containing protein [Butyricicoccus faecihominis]WNX83694.1 transglutaminase-like domain-containing protein [Agathobaculum sp. NTUH-O15-33]